MKKNKLVVCIFFFMILAIIRIRYGLMLNFVSKARRRIKGAEVTEGAQHVS